MKHYIGLDAHSKSSTFVVIDETGKELTAERIQTGEAALVGFVRSVSKPRMLTFEESNLSQWLYGLFQGEVEEQVVCNPVYLMKRKGPKGDYLDALHLAQQLRGNFLTPVVHEDSVLFGLRPLVRSYLGVVKDLKRAKCRLKALYRSQGRPAKGKVIYQDVERVAEFSDPSKRFIAEELLASIEHFETKRARYQATFRRYSRELPEIGALDTLPGMGATRSCITAAMVGTPARFASKYKFWSYCELVRHNYMSDAVSYGKRTRRANRELKNVFLGAAQRGIDTNAEIQAYYEWSLKKGLPHHSAKRNIARILAAISLAVMRTRQPYEAKIWKGKRSGKEIHIA